MIETAGARASAARRRTGFRSAAGPIALVLFACTMTAVAAAGAQGSRIVRAIEFDSDAWVDRRGLADLLPFAVGDPLRDEDLAEARRQLMSTRIFRSVELEVREEADGVRFVAHLDRKPVIARVRVSGYDGVQLNELRWLFNEVTRGVFGVWHQQELGRVEMRRLVQLREGVLFEPEMLDRAERRILERFYKLGYRYTQVRSRVHESHGEVDILLQIDPGAAVVVKGIEFAGEPCLSTTDWGEVFAPFQGKPHSRDLERKVRAAVLKHLRENNLFDARVNTSWASDGDLRGRVVVEASCGLPYDIAISGNEHLDDDDLQAVVDLNDRLIISETTWRLMARRMREKYQAKGYYKAEVTPTIEVEGGRKRVSFEVAEGRLYHLRKRTFRGNDHASAGELEDQMETRPSRSLPWPRRGAVVRATLEEDMARIEALYRARGFESASAKNDVVELDDGDLELVITIDEGPRTIVRGIEPSDFAAGLKLAQPLATVVDQPLRPEDLARDRDALVAALRVLGHRDAHVDWDVERQQKGDEVEAVVHWKLEPGPRYVIGPILVQDNVSVRNKLLLREIPFSTGDPLRVEELLQGQERIYSLGLFRSASVAEIDEEKDEERGEDEEGAANEAAPNPGGATEATSEDAAAAAPAEEKASSAESGAAEGGAAVPVPIAIRVTPRAPGRLSYGVGYNTRDGFTGFTEVSYNNLARRARTLRLRGELSLEPTTFQPTQYLASLTYVDPRFTGSPWRLELGVLGERNTQSISEYSIERTALGASASRPLWHRVQFGGDVQLELANVFDVEPYPFRTRDEENSRTTALGTFITFDRRNDAFNPTEGFINSLRVHYAPPGVSNVDFVQIDAEHTQFVPLGKYASFVVSLRAGWIRTFDNPIVPIRRRYFVGGGESVRGFAVNSLGPYDGDGNNVGGDLALVARSELRVPIAWGFGLAFFVDGGGNFLLRCDRSCQEGDSTDPRTRVSDSEAALSNFRPTAGLGLRYVSPVGPISVDYGIKLNRRTRDLADGRSDRESFGEFSVSIGARF